METIASITISTLVIAFRESNMMVSFKFSSLIYNFAMFFYWFSFYFVTYLRIKFNINENSYLKTMMTVTVVNGNLKSNAVLVLRPL